MKCDDSVSVRLALCCVSVLLVKSIEKKESSHRIGGASGKTSAAAVSASVVAGQNRRSSAACASSFSLRRADILQRARQPKRRDADKPRRTTPRLRHGRARITPEPRWARYRPRQPSPVAPPRRRQRERGRDSRAQATPLAPSPLLRRAEKTITDVVRASARVPAPRRSSADREAL